MVSTNFIEECKNPAYKNRLGKVQIGDDLLYLTVKEELKISNELKISGQATNEDKEIGYLSEITFNDSCYSNGSIIGTTISKTSTVKILDIRDFIGMDYIPSIGVKYSDNTTEYISIGSFTTQEQTIDKTAQNSTIKGQDKLYKLDETYICGINDWTNVTVKDLLLDLCTSLEIELGTTTFINEDISVSGDNYQKNYKNRDVLSDICEIVCSWAELGDDNKLYLNWFDDTVIDTLDKTQYSTLEKNSIYGEVNCLVIKDSNFEGENVTIQDEESIEINGETQIAIIDNNILNTEELRQEAITNIWNKIKGFKYVDCKIITYYGKPHLKRGSKIKVQDNDDSYFETYVLTHNFKYDGSFYSEISSPSLTKEQTLIKNTNLSPRQRILNAEAQVLKSEATIKLIVEEQEEFSNKIGTIEEKVDSITLELSDIENLEREVTSKNYIYIENGASGQILKFMITGSLKLLYPSDNLYPYDELYPLDSYLIVDKTKELSSEAKKIHLPFFDLDTNEKFIIEAGKTRIERADGIIEELDDINIELFDGENYIYLESFPDNNINLYAKYIIKNQYTDNFASKVEMNNRFVQTAETTELALSKKVGNDEIIAKINMSTEKDQDGSYIGIQADKIDLKGKEINLTGDDIIIKSTNFNVDEDGNLHCTNANISGVISSTQGKIGGWNIDSNGLNNDSVFIHNDGSSTVYTVADLIIIRGYIMDNPAFDLSDNMIEHYDINGDGVVNSADYILLQNLIGISMN